MDSAGEETNTEPFFCSFSFKNQFRFFLDPEVGVNSRGKTEGDRKNKTDLRAAELVLGHGVAPSERHSKQLKRPAAAFPPFLSASCLERP